MLYVRYCYSQSSSVHCSVVLTPKTTPDRDKSIHLHVNKRAKKKKGNAGVSVFIIMPLLTDCRWSVMAVIERLHICSAGRFKLFVCVYGGVWEFLWIRALEISKSSSTCSSLLHWGCCCDDLCRTHSVNWCLSRTLSRSGSSPCTTLTTAARSQRR